MARIPARVAALVTGASSGIGAEFARQLAARGHDLVIVARRRERLEALANALRVAHPSIHVQVLVADLETDEGREDVAARLGKGGPWIVVNNAGLGSRGPLLDVPLRREQEEIAVNVVALHRLTLAGLRANRDAGGGGAIVNIASQAAFQPLPYFATYAATKAFALSLTEAAAVEARHQNTRVLAVCPGPVRTEFIDSAGLEQEAKVFGLMVMRVDRCVRLALNALDRGDTICTPGALTTAGALAVRFVPRGLLRGVVGRAQEVGGMAHARRVSKRDGAARTTRGSTR